MGAETSTFAAKCFGRGKTNMRLCNRSLKCASLWRIYQGKEEYVDKAQEAVPNQDTASMFSQTKPVSAYKTLATIYVVCQRLSIITL